MTKKEIMNDKKFKQKCNKYGLDYESFEIYDNVILLNTKTPNLYVLFDKNYNTIGIEKTEEKIEELIKIKYYEYSNYTDNKAYREIFPYPFENYTLKNILDLYNLLDTKDNYSGINIIGDTKIKGDYYQLLSYIKFLGEEIEQYFVLNYHMKTLGFNTPDIYEYTKTLIEKLNECIDYYLNNNIKPLQSYILNGIGQNNQLKNDEILYNVIDLLIRDKGYKIKSSNQNYVEKIPTKDNKKLSSVADDILKILNEKDIKVKTLIK